jgi:hydroxypyruvate isomerase
MTNISVCAECFFTGFPFEQRIKKIASLGYKYIEFWHPEGTFDGKNIDFGQPKDAKLLKKVAADNGVKFNDFAFAAWDGSIGGSPTNASDHTKWFAQVQKMLDFSNTIDCSKGIILSGLLQPGVKSEQMNQNLLTAFSKAAKFAQNAGVVLLVEPLNSLVDHGGYYLDKTDRAASIIRQVNSPNLKLLFDVYHMQIMQGNILDFIQKNIDITGHFHSAGVPGRGELFDTEVNYPVIIKTLEQLSYSGCFGLEYFPKMDHETSLARTLKYLSA